MRNNQVHSEKIRDEILLTARDLFYIQGYQNTSVNHIIREIGIAKGTFYYYFQSKEELLKQIVDEIIHKNFSVFMSIKERTDLSLGDKFSNLLKLEVNQLPVSKHDYLFFIQPFYCDDNIFMRKMLFQYQMNTYLPHFIEIIKEGMSQDVIHTLYPEEGMEMVLKLGYDLNDEFIRNLLFDQVDRRFLDRMIRKYSIYEITTEHILGLPSNSISILEIDKLRNMIDRRNDIIA